MTVSVLDILHIVGAIVDDMLAVLDIVSLFAVCKDLQERASESSAVLKHVQTSVIVQHPCDAACGLIRLMCHMLNCNRPLTLGRASVVVNSVGLLRQYHRDGPPIRHRARYYRWDRYSHGLTPREPGDAWDVTIDEVDSWVQENPDCTIDGIDLFLDNLVVAWGGRIIGHVVPAIHTEEYGGEVFIFRY
jgi:hypothetical protein